MTSITHFRQHTNAVYLEYMIANVSIHYLLRSTGQKVAVAEYRLKWPITHAIMLMTHCVTMSGFAMNTYQFDSSFKVKNGCTIRVRQLLPGDTTHLVDIFDHMSSESRYQRFNQTLDRVVPEKVWREAFQITNTDPARSQGLIAFAAKTPEYAAPIGAVRYVETAPGVAEVAISIRDDFQNMGVGKRLMLLLALHAKKIGYHLLTGSIRNDNPAIWKVFKSLPFEVARTPEGSYSEVTVNLDVPHEAGATSS
jgi:RimJ/RimL family protein N-acetyltransferase